MTVRRTPPNRRFVCNNFVQRSLKRGMREVLSYLSALITLNRDDASMLNKDAPRNPNGNRHRTRAALCKVSRALTHTHTHPHTHIHRRRIPQPPDPRHAREFFSLGRNRGDRSSVTSARSNPTGEPKSTTNHRVNV